MLPESITGSFLANNQGNFWKLHDAASLFLTQSSKKDHDAASMCKRIFAQTYDRTGQYVLISWLKCAEKFRVAFWLVHVTCKIKLSRDKRGAVCKFSWIPVCTSRKTC